MKVCRASCHTVEPSQDELEWEPEPRALQRVPSLRSIAPTLPAPQEPCRVLLQQTLAFGPPPLDEVVPVSGKRRRRRSREWCVDFVTRIDTMTTFELWVAIASREVGPDVRVWREGMECWLRVGEMPELACAVTDASTVDTGWEAPGSPATEAAPPPRSARPPIATSAWTDIRPAVAETPTVEEAREEVDAAIEAECDAEAPTPPLVAPVAPIARASHDGSPPMNQVAGEAVAPRLRAAAPRRRRRAAAGAPWVAVGAAFGVLAIGVASLAGSPPEAAHRPAPVALTGMRSAVGSVSASTAPLELLTPGRDDGAGPRADAPGAPRRDPGQRRLRRGK